MKDVPLKRQKMYMCEKVVKIPVYNKSCNHNVTTSATQFFFRETNT